MRLSLVGPVYPYRGGIALYNSLLAQAASKRHNVQVISFKRQYPSFLYPGKSDRDPSQDTIQVEAEYLLDPVYPWTWSRAAQTISNFHPDVAVLQWWTTFWSPAYAWMAAWLERNGIPTVYLIHNVLPHEPRVWDLPLARLALAKGAYFITQTSRETQRLLQILPTARVVECPHPIYDLYASQRIPPQEARSRLNLDPGRPVLLFFGLVRPYKGLRLFLNALSQLKQQGICPQVVIAGEFWEGEAEYRQLVKQLELVDQVTLTNRYISNEEVPVYFSAADAFVAPYLDSTQSGAVKLAIGFGLPVIASDSLLVDEALSISPLVRAFSTGSVEAFANSIRSFMGKPTALPSAPKLATGTGWDQLVSTIESISETVKKPDPSRTT